MHYYILTSGTGPRIGHSADLCSDGTSAYGIVATASILSGGRAIQFRSPRAKAVGAWRMARYLGAVFLSGWLAASLASAQEVTDQSHTTTVPSSVDLFNYGDFD